MAKKQPEIGYKFHDLTVVSQLDGTTSKWNCQCTCGKTVVLYTSDVFGGKRTSCGHRLESEIKVGDVFKTNAGGDVVVVEYIHANDIIVEFPSGYRRSTTSGNLQKGKVLDKTIKRVNIKKRLTQEEFISESKELSGDKYGYNKVVYQGLNTPVTLVCDIHGDFEIMPASHIIGCGCVDCGIIKRAASNKKTTSEYVEDAFKTHGDLYGYDKAIYTGAQDKIEIHCKTHGYFWQEANSHLRGCGCTDCGYTKGYSTLRPGNLYVLHGEGVTKVGITNRESEIRLAEVSKASKRKLEILTVYNLSGIEALRVETKVHRFLNSKYQNMGNAFDGSTECFLDVNLPELINKIEETLGNQ